MARKQGQLLGHHGVYPRGTMIERRSNHRPTGINPVVTILPLLSFWLSISVPPGTSPAVTEPRLEIAHGHLVSLFRENNNDALLMCAPCSTKSQATAF